MNRLTDTTGVDFDTVIPREHSGALKWTRYRDRDILPFWVADMDFAMAEPIRQALIERLAHPILGYTVAEDSLLEAIAAHLAAEYDWTIDTDWLVILPGVVPGLAASCRAFCNTGDRILVNPPIYHHFFDAHDERSHELVRVPLRCGSDHRWSYDLAAMRTACEAGMRLVMLNSPHNPVGTVYRPDELRAVVELAAEFDALVISDEIHCDLVLDRKVRHTPTALAAPHEASRVVTLMSASKTWNLAGLNGSFAIIADADLRARFRQACVSHIPPTPPLALLATEVAYREGGPWRQALLDYLADNYALVRDTLSAVPGLEVHPLQATYLAWIDASGLGLNDTKGFFESHGVGLSGGEGFGQPHFVRLNFACPRSMLREGLQRMVQAVQTLG